MTARTQSFHRQWCFEIHLADLVVVDANDIIRTLEETETDVAPVSVDPSALNVSVNPWRCRQNIVGSAILVAIVAKTAFVKTVFANQATIATDSDVLDGSTSQNFGLAHRQHNALLFL